MATDFPVVVRCPVLWGDMDALGHVNNSRYFTWFESARIAFFERVGIVSEETPNIGPILAHTECDFLIPVKYPADIESCARVASIGTSSFVMEHEIRLVDGNVVARGSGVVVLLDYATGKSDPIPDSLRRRITEVGH